MEISVLEGITLAIAVLGAVLGMTNTWHALDRSRAKLKVVPAHAIPVGGMNPSINFAIEITNLSAFPVTVHDAGVLYRGTEARGSFTNPIIIDGKPWPRRLEPRSSVSVYGQRPQSTSEHRVKCAYARTQCGLTVTGNSGALRQIARGDA